MTTRQIQELLLTHYLFAIEMVKEEKYSKAKSMADELRVDGGVCFCCGYVIGAKIAHKNWVIRNKAEGSSHWGPIPYDAKSKSEILSRLKLRVDILNKEIQLSK
jgi:hypothetical protein